MSPNEPNPFEVLRLDPGASEEEIVRAAGRLRLRAADEHAAAGVRQAVQALTGPAEARRLHALLTHPKPCYDWPALERFVAAFRRRPQAAPDALPPCPPLDLAEFEALLLPLLAEELNVPPRPFAPVAAAEPPEEIRRQTVEALWQALLFDPGA